jgi:hypothetical protein
MKTASQICATITKRASRDYGVSRREVRDSFQHDERAQVPQLLCTMIRLGSLFEFTRSTSACGRHQVRLFVTSEDGAKWAAGQVQMPVAPQKPTRAQNAAANPITIVKPKQAPAKFSGAVDYSRAIVTVAPTPKPRFSVELAKGHVSALDPQECRPWAQFAG